MQLESPFAAAVWKYQSGNGGKQSPVQRHLLVAEYIRSHTVRTLSFKGGKKLLRTVRGKADIVIQHQDAIA